MSAIIYRLTNTVNGKIYIGQTSCGLDIRWRQHCYMTTFGSSYYIHNAIRKYGTDTFTREILEETTTELVSDRETYWIAKLHPEYNMTSGGEGAKGISRSKETRNKISQSRKGIKFSEEHKAKLRAAKRGKNHPNYGKHLSDETRAKISAAQVGENHHMYGKTHSTETRAKVSAAVSGENHPFYGKKHSDETRAKMKAGWAARRERLAAEQFQQS